MMRNTWFTALALASTLTTPVDPDGTVHLPPLSMPYSSLASGAAKQAFIVKMHSIAAAAGSPRSGEIAVIRRKTLLALTPLLEQATARYPVKIVEETIAGVPTQIVTPSDGVSAKNRNRVLINLHGGGFFVGAGIGGKLESVPIAAVGKFKIVSVDYRQGPEFKFPAASEDVASVYVALLKQYRPKNVGIYGCSAGGLLTAEVAAWLQRKGLPAPGAIGIFCASAGGWSGGDSTYFTAAFYVNAAPSEAGHAAVSDAAYFGAADMKDPLVAPLWSPAVLGRFPPTLILTSTRDIALSSAVFTHRQLVNLGVDAELHVWDGLDHGFFMDCRLPESAEAYAVIVKFFERRLAQ